MHQKFCVFFCLGDVSVDNHHCWDTCRHWSTNLHGVPFGFKEKRKVGHKWVLLACEQTCVHVNTQSVWWTIQDVVMPLRFFWARTYYVWILYILPLYVMVKLFSEYICVSNKCIMGYIEYECFNTTEIFTNYYYCLQKHVYLHWHNFFLLSPTTCRPCQTTFFNQNREWQDQQWL